MFTGIIEELGTVDRPGDAPAGARLKVRCATVVLADMTEGASIAVNGVCLTAVDLRPDSFSADLAPETLRAAIWAICGRLARQSGAPALAPGAA
jgi:riboflavin synthase